MKLPDSHYFPGDEGRIKDKDLFQYLKKLLMEHKRVYEEIARVVNANSKYLGDISGGNYTEIEDDGTLVATGNATTYNDLLPSSVTVGAGASIPSFTAFNGNLKGYEFLGSGVTTKDLIIGFQISHAYKEASIIVPHIHLYVPNDGTGGVVKFGLEYTWVNVSSAEPATTTLYATSTIAAAAGNQGNLIVSFGNIAGTSKTISSILYARLFRNPADAADTFGSSVWLKSADIHIEQDMTGSRQELTK